MLSDLNCHMTKILFYFIGQVFIKQYSPNVLQKRLNNSSVYRADTPSMFLRRKYTYGCIYSTCTKSYLFRYKRRYGTMFMALSGQKMMLHIKYASKIFKIQLKL